MTGPAPREGVSGCARLNRKRVDALNHLRRGRIALSLPQRLVLADKQEMALDEPLSIILRVWPEMTTTPAIVAAEMRAPLK